MREWSSFPFSSYGLPRRERRGRHRPLLHENDNRQGQHTRHVEKQGRPQEQCRRDAEENLFKHLRFPEEIPFQETGGHDQTEGARSDRDDDIQDRSVEQERPVIEQEKEGCRAPLSISRR